MDKTKERHTGMKTDELKNRKKGMQAGRKTVTETDIQALRLKSRKTYK